MKAVKYFDKWTKVIDFRELKVVLDKLSRVNPELLCPKSSDVFKAFKLCSYDKCKVVLAGQDPYPQKGVATGILFGNDNKTPENKLSPSLQVIKEAVINFEIPHNNINFDNSLEFWSRQGVLMLNTALTCTVNNIGSHTMLWRKFIASLFKELSNKNTGIVYVLFGSQAQSFEPYINKEGNKIIKVQHPSYFYRVNKSMPSEIFQEVNRYLKDYYNEPIKWFNEY
jgi:uracil-DNA glycosylase